MSLRLMMTFRALGAYPDLVPAAITHQLGEIDVADARPSSGRGA
jgi:hypothetical protein